MKKVFIGLFISSVLMAACSKSNETTQNNNANTGSTDNGVCNTTNMKFVADIQPILKSNCYSCHGNGQQEGGVTLDTYTGVKKQVDNNNLVGVITHAAGYPPMPQGGAKLSDCNINKIKSWITDGALEN